MKSRYIIAAAGTALMLGGCVIAIGGDDDGVSASYTSHASGFDSVYAADVSANTISFIVPDNGCTDESFFDIAVRKVDDNEFKVGVERTRQDYCKVNNPNGKQVSWSFSQLGIPAGAEITILNGVRR